MERLIDICILEVDITELEDFRKLIKEEAEQEGVLALGMGVMPHKQLCRSTEKLRERAVSR